MLERFEGFALLVANRACQAPTEVRPPPLPIPLADMATEAQFQALRAANAQRASDNARLAVERLAARFGDAKVVQLIAALRDAELEPALQKTLGIDLAGAQEAAIRLK